jgi:hypothetical protein
MSFDGMGERHVEVVAATYIEEFALKTEIAGGGLHFFALGSRRLLQQVRQ